MFFSTDQPPWPSPAERTVVHTNHAAVYHVFLTFFAHTYVLVRLLSVLGADQASLVEQL